MKKIILLGCLCLSLNIVAQSWTPIADFPAGMHHPVTWAIDGFGYAATGTDATNSPTKDFYRYDPSTDSWTTMAQFPGSPRSFAMGVAYKGIGYLGFGATTVTALRDLWSYDPATDSWSPLAPCPCNGRRHPSFVATNDAIYVGLGDGQGGNYKDWWKYDIPTNSWSQLPDLPGPPRHHPFQFVVNNKVYAGLGHAGNVIYKDWYQLDPTTDSWTQMSDFPGEARVAGTQFDHAKKGYVLSGDGDNHSFMADGEFWEYDDVSDSWTQLASHPGRSRWAPGSFIINDKVFFFGGLDRGNNQLRVEGYKYSLPSTVSLAENEPSMVKVYPNPADNWLLIESKTEFEGVEILNSTGQLVVKTGQVQELELSHLPAGVYHLRIVGKAKTLWSQKLLVQ